MLSAIQVARHHIFQFWVGENIGLFWTQAESVGLFTSLYITKNNHTKYFQESELHFRYCCPSVFIYRFWCFFSHCRTVEFKNKNWCILRGIYPEAGIQASPTWYHILSRKKWDITKYANLKGFFKRNFGDFLGNQVFGETSK